MKIYEFPAKIGPHGSLIIPRDLIKSLGEDETVRVIIVVNEATERRGLRLVSVRP